MCRSSTPAVLDGSNLFRGLLLTVLGSGSNTFRGLLLTVLGSRRDFHDRRTPGCVYVSVINTRSFWPNLTRFVDYYSLFWGPGVISTIDEPRGAFTCW